MKNLIPKPGGHKKNVKAGQLHLGTTVHTVEVYKTEWVHETTGKLAMGVYTGCGLGKSETYSLTTTFYTESSKSKGYSVIAGLNPQVGGGPIAVGGEVGFEWSWEDAWVKGESVEKTIGGTIAVPEKPGKCRVGIVVFLKETLEIGYLRYSQSNGEWASQPISRKVNYITGDFYICEKDCKQ